MSSPSHIRAAHATPAATMSTLGGDGPTTGAVAPPAPPTSPATRGEPPLLSVGHLVASEGDGYFDVVFTLSAAARQPVSVDWAAGGTAQGDGVDFDGRAGSVQFAAGESTKTVRIRLADDSVDELTESLVLTLSNAVNATLQSSTALLTIIDDDAAVGTPVITVRDTIVDESAGTASFVVLLDRPANAGVSVAYATTGGNALAGSDFTAASGTLSFAVGQTVRKVTVPLKDDAAVEGLESFNLALSAARGATLGDALGTARIGANDQAAVTKPVISAASTRVSEAEGYAEIVFQLSAPSADIASLRWASANGSALAGSDFTATSGRLNFLPGQTTATLRLDLADDGVAESTETFSLRLSAADNASLGNTTLSVTLIDDDSAGVRVFSYGLGDDRYTVASSGDRVVENSNGGNDLVTASASHTLGDHVERLTLSGSGKLDGTGNGLANTLTGNGGRNLLAGGSGNDTLNGAGGNDTLDGGPGKDSMSGGTGNDSYVVDHSGDRINETTAASTEIDSVTSHVSWTLGSNLERLTLAGGSALEGIGNAAHNHITGNTAANLLDGTGGNDTLLGGDGADTLNGGNGSDSLNGGSGGDSMAGGAGNDRYVVQHSADRTIEASGGGTADSVSSSIAWTLAAEIEKLVLTGTGAINGVGNALSNTLTGNASDNRLTGGGGNDTLIGGAGIDIFRFSSALNASTNVDTITDFVATDDSLQLENSVFTKLASVGVLASSQFRASTSGTARDSNDFVLYETDTGKLFYDADGSGVGAKLLVAVFSGLPTLGSADVFVT